MNPEIHSPAQPMSTSVSVIIPAYNAAAFVAEAIDSALAQSHRDVEVVVVDDGSTDATAEILAGYRSRITVLQQSNRGPAAARNRALRVAGGTMLALLDADDRWEESFLARGINRLSASSDQVVGAFSGWVAVDHRGGEILTQGGVESGTVGLRELVLGNRFPPSALVLRLDAVRASGGFDEDIPSGVEDYDLWLRLAAGGALFAGVGGHPCRYRVRADSVSHQVDTMRLGRLRCLEKVFARTDLPDDVRAARPRALASAYMQAAVELYAAERPAEGERDFARAAHSWPEILADDETYYAVICATQPLGFKASRHGFDLAEGERRITAALARCRRDGAITSAAARRQAQGRALRTLARLAYGQRRMGLVRRYVAGALAADPTLCADRSMLATFAKSLAGAQVIEALSRRKPRRGAPPR